MGLFLIADLAIRDIRYDSYLKLTSWNATPDLKEIFKDFFANTPEDLDAKVTTYIENLSTVSDKKKKYISSSLKTSLKNQQF